MQFGKFQAITWWRIGDKPLHEPMTTQLIRIYASPGLNVWILRVYFGEGGQCGIE